MIRMGKCEKKKIDEILTGATSVIIKHMKRMPKFMSKLSFSFKRALYVLNVV